MPEPDQSNRRSLQPWLQGCGVLLLAVSVVLMVARDVSFAKLLPLWLGGLLLATATPVFFGRGKSKE